MYFSTAQRIPLDVGAGDPVLCLHGSLGSHRQWRPLAERLSTRYRVLAADLLGYGDDSAWPAGMALQLGDEARALAPALRALSRPAHLVAHSYGAAVALRLALDHPEQVRSLTLYEPVLFGLLLAAEPGAPVAREIRGYADTVAMLAQRGALHAAGRNFVDYWNEHGSWDALPPHRQARLARRMHKVAAEWGAVFTETTTAAALGAVSAPVTLLCGARTRAPARRVVELLGARLPRAATCYLPEADHGAPFTRAEKFNRGVDVILRRLERREPGLPAAA